jgi:hypothetical protein
LRSFDAKLKRRLRPHQPGREKQLTDLMTLRWRSGQLQRDTSGLTAEWREEL